MRGVVAQVSHVNTSVHSRTSVTTKPMINISSILVHNSPNPGLRHILWRALPIRPGLNRSAIADPTQRYVSETPRGLGPPRVDR